MAIRDIGIKVPIKIHRNIAASARRGAKLLDKRVPGWFNRIDTSTLDLRLSCDCIYGQLSVTCLLDEIESARALDEMPRYYDNGNNAEGQFGYYIPKIAEEWAKYHKNYLSVMDVCWDILQEEWLREIYNRRSDHP